MQLAPSRARWAVPLAALAAALASSAPGCKCGGPSLRSQAPQLEVTPAALTVQPLPVGKTSLSLIQVRNAGNADLHFKSLPTVSDLAADGAASDFSLTAVLDHDCSGGKRGAAGLLTLGPGECARIVVQYAPPGLDADSGEVKLETDDPDRPVVHVPISLGDAARLTICALDDTGKQLACDDASGAPPTVPFGHAAQGATVTRRVRLRNDGKSTLDISAVQGPDGPMKAEFASDISAVPSKLQAGATADVTVKFAPVGGGFRTAWIEVDSGDPLRPSVQVPLKGQGDGPALCADPSPVVFGATNIGVPVDKTLTLTSCGTAPVSLKQVAFDNLSSVAFSSTNLPGPRTLQPGATVQVSLRFRPDSAGDTTGALLTPTADSPDAFVLLKGTGNDAPVCRLGASVTTLDFAQVVRGGRAERSLQLANRGKQDCKLSGMAITAGSSYFSVKDPLAQPVTLRPNDVFSFTIVYAPPLSDTNSSDSGTAEATSDDPITPKLDVQLIGVAAASPICKLQITPAVGGFFAGRTLQFGNVTVGHAKVLPATFKNVGSANCNVQSYKLTTPTSIFGGCSNSDCQGFSIAQPLPQGPIQPGQSTSVNVQFKPVDTNQVSFIPTVYLDVQTTDQALTSECIQEFPPNNNAGCIEVGLAGQGIVSSLAVLPSDLDFGLVTLGCRSKTETVTLYNTGNGSFTIKSLRLDPTTAPFFLVAPPTPFTMQPGSRIALQVTYRPSQAAKETATLYIESDASNTTSNNPYVTVALSGTGTTDKHQTDTFTQATVPKVDLLFVIDDSGTFYEFEQDISKNAQQFLNRALQYKADFHIGVSANDPVQHDADKNAAYRVPIYPGGLYGQPGIIDSSTPDPVGAFSKNVQLGTGGSGGSDEAGLQLTWQVLSAPSTTKPAPQGSQGFLRDDARLVVVDVQDDDDTSQATTAFYIDFLQSLKGRYNAGLVSFNAIGAFDDKGQPAQCDPNMDDPGQRYYDVAQATKGQTFSICNADWAKIADSLSLGAFAGRKQFALSRYADPATLSVTLNGAAQTLGSDYTYDQASNSVVFNLVPPAGAVIVASYDALCF